MIRNSISAFIKDLHTIMEFNETYTGLTDEQLIEVLTNELKLICLVPKKVVEEMDSKGKCIFDNFYYLRIYANSMYELESTTEEIIENLKNVFFDEYFFKVDRDVLLLENEIEEKKIEINYLKEL